MMYSAWIVAWFQSIELVDAPVLSSFDSDQLVGITFGMRISDANRKALTKRIAKRKSPIHVFEAVDSDQFAIDFKPIA
jgi:hypothetical protein